MVISASTAGYGLRKTKCPRGVIYNEVISAIFKSKQTSLLKWASMQIGIDMDVDTDLHIDIGTDLEIHREFQTQKNQQRVTCKQHKPEQ